MRERVRERESEEDGEGGIAERREKGTERKKGERVKKDNETGVGEAERMTEGEREKERRVARKTEKPKQGHDKGPVNWCCTRVIRQRLQIITIWF